MGATHTGVTLESLEFHRGSGTYRARYDEETTAASMAVVTAVTEVLDADPVDLTPLFDSVDTDALDELVDGETATDGSVHTSFPFEDHEIGVSSDGVVAVTPLSPADDRDGDR